MKNKFISRILIVFIFGIHQLSAQTLVGKINAQSNGVTILYNGTSEQSFPNSTAFTNQEIYNLTINNSVGVKASGGFPLNLKGTLSLSSGNFVTAGGLSLYGNINYTSGGIIAGNDTIKFAGSATQNIPSKTFISNTVARIEIDNSYGITSNDDIAITNSLKLCKLNNGSSALSAQGKTITITSCRLAVSKFDILPVIGQTYNIVTCGSLIGKFSTVSLPVGITGNVSYTKTSAMLTISATTNVDQSIELSQEFTVYPNPVINDVTIIHERASVGAMIWVYDALGRKSVTMNVVEEATKSNISVQKLLAGAYFLVFINAGNIQTNRFIKQ